MFQLESLLIIPIKSMQFISSYQYIFAIIGFIVFLKFILKLILSLWRSISLKQNILKRYAKNQPYSSYAVITGATDGVGLGFAQQLLQHKFNIFIISRNQQKIKAVIQKLKASQPNATFKYLVADFKNSYQSQFYQNMIKQLSTIDIAILVNNVGTSLMKDIQKFSIQQILDIISINCASMAVLTSKLIPQLKLRNKSAIINLSSYSAQLPVPKISLYSATKSFNSIFSNTVALQHPQIDILSAKPLFIQSPLSKFKKGWLVPDRRENARAVINQLGKEYETHGCLIHKLADIIISLIPIWLIRFIITIGANKMKKHYKDNKKQ